jgi:hypothetical protein
MVPGHSVVWVRESLTNAVVLMIIEVVVAVTTSMRIGTTNISMVIVLITTSTAVNTITIAIAVNNTTTTIIVMIPVRLFVVVAATVGTIVEIVAVAVVWKRHRVIVLSFLVSWDSLLL